MKPIHERAIDTIRTLAMDAVQKANSGHPGTAMALAPVAYLLYREVMRHDPTDPKWPDRDRFVLSAGHACILQYSALALSGYDLTVEDLKQLPAVRLAHARAIPSTGTRPGSRPRPGRSARASATPSASRSPSACWPRATTGRGTRSSTTARTSSCSDGDLMEGVSAEASSIAGHLALGRLIAIYDDNHITIEGDTAIAFTEDVGGRYAAYGWHVQRFDDTWTLGDLRTAIDAAHADPRPEHDHPAHPHRPGRADEAGQPPRPTAPRSARRRSAAPSAPTAGPRTSTS